MKPGQRMSLQYHNKRTERWIIIKGRATAIIKNVKHFIKNGDEIIIPSGVLHRLEAFTDLTVLEISYGEFEESDIVRVEDDYNKVISDI